jgi:hypothetical protein
LLAVTVMGAIHILCETDPSLETAVVNGLLAWAAVLGGCAVFCSGLPAAVAIFIPARPRSLSKRIDHWQGYGFVAGMLLGLLMFFVFIAKVIS